MVFRSLPKKDPFFVLFSDEARLVLQAAELLHDLLENFSDVERKAARIHELEEQADLVVRQITVRLHKTVITPFDREDIYRIAHEIDTVLDFIDGVASRLALYHVERPTDAAQQFGRLILTGAQALGRIMDVLHKQDAEALREPSLTINHIENEGDNLLRSVIAGLFRGGLDPLEVVKWKEIYEALEEATDRLEQTAHLLEVLIVKHA